MKFELLDFALIALLISLAFACQQSKADLPDNALPLLMLERQGADETEVRRVLGEPIKSQCTVTQPWQSWLDYSPVSRPCSIIARFLAGLLVVTSPDQSIVVVRREK